jgi:hypothetical protein
MVRRVGRQVGSHSRFWPCCRPWYYKSRAGPQSVAPRGIPGVSTAAVNSAAKVLAGSIRPPRRHACRLPVSILLGAIRPAAWTPCWLKPEGRDGRRSFYRVNLENRKAFILLQAAIRPRGPPRACGAMLGVVATRASRRWTRPPRVLPQAPTSRVNALFDLACARLCDDVHYDDRNRNHDSNREPRRPDELLE